MMGGLAFGLPLTTNGKSGFVERRHRQMKEAIEGASELALPAAPAPMRRALEMHARPENPHEDQRNDASGNYPDIASVQASWF